MDVVVNFTNNGALSSGLSPTVKIVDVGSGSIVVASGVMSEIANADGWYLYDFSGYDATESYIITADAGTDFVDDRYPAIATNSTEVAEAVWSYNRSSEELEE